MMSRGMMVWGENITFLLGVNKWMLVMDFYFGSIRGITSRNVEIPINGNNRILCLVQCGILIKGMHILIEV